MAASSFYATVSTAMTRPADTSPYASGDIVANSTTPGSITPLSFSDQFRITGTNAAIRRARLVKSGTSTTNASFRLHLYGSSPTPTSGDNQAWNTNQASTYMGAIDITCDRAFSDGAYGDGAATNGSEIIFHQSGQTIFWLLEARAAYTPGSAETFTPTIEVFTL